MKKVTLLGIFFLSLAFGLLTSSNISFAADKFELVSSDVTVNIEDENEFEGIAAFDIKNKTDQTVNCKVKIMINELGPNHAVALCTFYCFDYVTKDWDGCEEFPLLAGEKTSDVMFPTLQAHCKPNGNKGTTKATYRIYDVNDPSSYLDVPITFNFGITSVNDMNADSFVAAYPNPTDGILSVYSEHQNIKSIKVYSLSGEMVLREDNMLGNAKALDLSRVAKGSYLMKIELADGSMRSSTIIVE